MHPTVVTTADLLAEGLDHPTIRILVAQGKLRRLRRGVFERGTPESLPPETAHRRLIEAVRAQHPDALFSHISAAVLHSLPVPNSSVDRAHLIRSGPGGSKRMGSLYLHRSIHPIAPVLVDGHLATALDRTVVDLVRVLRGPDALAIADRALAVGLDRDSALALVAAEPGRRGNVQARQTLLLADPRAESAGESWTRWSMAQAGLPMPELQAEFHDPATGRFIARTDFYWPEHRLVGEFDGESKYGRLLKPGQSIEEVVRSEKVREEDIRRLGPWMVRFIASEANRPLVVEKIVRNGFRLALGDAA